jgi:hypothetical protein
VAAIFGVALLLSTIRWNNHRPHHAFLAVIVGILIANTAVGRFVRSVIDAGVHALTHIH